MQHLWKIILALGVVALMGYIIYLNSIGNKISLKEGVLGNSDLEITKDDLNIKLTSKKEKDEGKPLEKKVKRIKSLSMKEAIEEYLGYQNISDYDKSFEFVNKLDKTLSIESYKKFWKKHREQFILYSIDEKNHTFKIIIDYEKGYNDVLNMYDFELHSNKKWYITKGTKIKELKEFDNWKLTGLEKLHSIDKNISNGKVYELYPTTTSSFIKKLPSNTEVKAYVDTDEGRFYLSKWSFQNLINNEKYNWIHTTE